MDKLTEREIILGLRHGDRRAWLRLYDEYADRIWNNVARLMGADSVAVADVVQETFLAAARSAGSYKQSRASLGTWLNGIARMQIAIYYRKHDSRNILNRLRDWWGGLDGNKDDWISSKEPIPPEVLEARELAGMVRHVLRQLPEKYQAVLLAKYIDGESTKTIAENSGCTSLAVTARLGRAKAAFRKEFARTTAPARNFKEVL